MGAPAVWGQSVILFFLCAAIMTLKMGDSNCGIRQIEKFIMHQCQKDQVISDGPELTTAVFGAQCFGEI